MDDSNIEPLETALTLRWKVEGSIPQRFIRESARSSHFEHQS